VVFIPDKTKSRLVNPEQIFRIFGIPCEKIIGLVNIKGREGKGIMEGLDVASADNSTNGNISTLCNEIEGVGVGSLLLDCMRSRLQPLAMEHHLLSLRILVEIPDLCKPK